MKKYFVSGLLESDDPGEGVRYISQEVEAESPAAAIAIFEYDGWEFRPVTLAVWRVTETDRMEAAGQPTLFALPERKFKTVELAAEDYERRERWRQYQVYCGWLIDRFGVAGAKKVMGRH